MSVFFRIIFSCIFVFSSTVVSAEIFKCLDENGRSSFSQTPCPAEVVSGDSEVHQLWREMRVLVNKGVNIYSALGPDVQSILECKHSVEAFSAELDAIDVRLEALSANEHKNLFLAQAQLRQCGQCRSAARQYCLNSTEFLNLEMNTLLSDQQTLARSQ